MKSPMFDKIKLKGLIYYISNSNKASDGDFKFSKIWDFLKDTVKYDIILKNETNEKIQTKYIVSGPNIITGSPLINKRGCDE